MWKPIFDIFRNLFSSKEIGNNNINCYKKVVIR